jgi:hypothetical protein
MRRLIMLAALSSLLLVGAAHAEIGWAGNAFPNSGALITPTGDQFVVAQVYKAGVTDQPGEGPDIAATLLYAVDGGAQQSVAMAYNVDIGNNDEYLGFIPQAALVGAGYVEVTVIFDDLSDGTSFEITADQAGNPPPLRYDVVDVTPVDVDVTFTLCMSGEPFTGAPCVIGSAPEIGEWVGQGVTMTQLDGDLWEVTVTFAAGSNPAVEYKYKKDDCTVFEDGGNRTLVLPTDGTASVVLEPDSYSYRPLGCGLGEVLGQLTEVCFQVCMQGVEYDGDVCVTGNLPELSEWQNGIPMMQVGPDLFQACLYFEPGTPIPLEIQYKFKKDACETWESIPGNRVVILDNSTPAEFTTTHTWDDGDGICEPVSTENHSWSAVKDLYR